MQEALAELGRAMGSDQPANYQLADEPLARRTARHRRRSGRAGHEQSARARRPALFARRRLQIRGRGKGSVPAHRQRDRGGRLIPYINTAPIPAEYEGVAANVSIPVFNGHLFSARREAADQRAMESRSAAAR